MAANRYFYFLDLRAELRKMVYSYTFRACCNSPVEILRHAGGPDAGLRETCKLIRAESEAVYLKASSNHYAELQALYE